MKHCPTCDSPRIHAGTTDVRQALRSRKAPASAVVKGVPAVLCADCGESVVYGKDLRRAELLAARELIGRGIRSGELLSWCRRSVGLLATELGELLAVSAETISRWENDRREAEPAVWNTVADLVEDALAERTTTQDRMRARASKGRKTVAVDFEPGKAAR